MSVKVYSDIYMDTVDHIFNLLLLAIQGRVTIPQIKTQYRGWNEDVLSGTIYEIIVDRKDE